MGARAHRGKRSCYTSLTGINIFPVVPRSLSSGSFRTQARRETSNAAGEGWRAERRAASDSTHDGTVTSEDAQVISILMLKK